MEKTPAKGMRFEHRRVLDPTALPEKKPMKYEVSKVTASAIYYKPVYTYYGDGYSREELGKPEYCQREQFERLCVLNVL